MSDDKFYFKLPWALQSRVEILNMLENDITESSWSEYHGFNVLPLGTAPMLTSPHLTELHKRHPFKNMGIIRMDPYTNYDWHTDGVRGVSLNALISDPMARTCCLFRNSHSVTPMRRAHSNFNVTELVYESNAAYLLNVQLDHMVLNLSSKPRYMFSIEFMEDKTKLTYEDLRRESEFAPILNVTTEK